MVAHINTPTSDEKMKLTKMSNNDRLDFKGIVVIIHTVIVIAMYYMNDPKTLAYIGVPEPVLIMDIALLPIYFIGCFMLGTAAYFFVYVIMGGFLWYVIGFLLERAFKKIIEIVGLLINKYNKRM